MRTIAQQWYEVIAGGVWRSGTNRRRQFVLAIVVLLLVGCSVIAGAEVPKRAHTLEAATPNPKFVDLPDGVALDLGRYECESRVPDFNCRTIFDFSRINYDPFNHRMLIFGGGHAATGRTDIDVFDLDTLQWRSLYLSMSCKSVAEGDVAPGGFHRKSGHPVARHTYDQNVVAEWDGEGWLIMFSTEGFRGHCHPYKATIKSVASFPLTGSRTSWMYSPEMKTPWKYASAAEFDPVSGMIILASGQSRGLWVYDPKKQEIVASLWDVPTARDSPNLIYDPRGDKMYLITRKTLAVRQFTLDRKDWSKTSGTLIEPRGIVPPPMRNFAYDSRNHVIGGIKEGVFYAFDLESLTWSAHPVEARSPDGVKVGSVQHHAIDYDPVNNVFVFVTDKASGRRTWAYRYRN